MIRLHRNTRVNKCYHSICGILAVTMILSITQCSAHHEKLETISLPYHARPHNDLYWAPCDDNHADSDCALIKVPLDYNQQNSETIHIGISRLKVTNETQRLGVLFVNAGAGADGDKSLGIIDGLIARNDPELQEKIRADFTQLRKHFDIIGFDPRGLGKGSQLSCPIQLVAHPNISLPPTQLNDFIAQGAFNRNFALACQHLAGPLIRYVDARSEVADIESIRLALGESVISYYGVSYGTEIGQLYAEKYPHNLRAIALDGNVNHTYNLHSAPEIFTAEATTNEALLRFYDSQCKTNPHCDIPHKNLIASYEKLLSDAEHGLLYTTEEEKLIPATIMFYVRNLFSRANTSAVLTQLSRLLTRDRNVLDELGSAFNSNNPQYQLSFTIAQGCQDFMLSPLNYQRFSQWVSESKQKSPHFYRSLSFLVTQTYCINWPIPANNPPALMQIDPKLSILLIANHLDPITPKENALAFRKIASSSRLLLTNSVGHTALLHSHNGRVAIVHYIMTLELPNKDWECDD